MQVEYRNSTGLLAVTGDPIAHSLSPLLQNTMIRTLGRDDLYLALRVERENLPEFLRAAKTIGIAGFNLTMPHKETVIPFLRELTPEARRAGSVNSVRVEAEGFYGHSTDGLGFRRSIRDQGYDFPGAAVTILGAGGAARSIAMTALDAGARQVRVVNRTLARAEALCAGEPNMAAFPWQDAEGLMGDTDILVNTTPVGMEGAGETGGFPFLRTLPREALAADCVYAPAMTPFMAAAGARGARAVNGIGMLVYQAIYAYAFFRKLSFSEEEVTRLGGILLKITEIDPGGG